MCAVVPSAAIYTDKTLFTLNISNKKLQTFAARRTERGLGAPQRFAHFYLKY